MNLVHVCSSFDVRCVDSCVLRFVLVVAGSYEIFFLHIYWSISMSTYFTGDVGIKKYFFKDNTIS